MCIRGEDGAELVGRGNGSERTVYVMVGLADVADEWPLQIYGRDSRRLTVSVLSLLFLPEESLDWMRRNRVASSANFASRILMEAVELTEKSSVAMA